MWLISVAEYDETIQTMAFDVPQNLQEMVQGAPLRHTANCDSVSPESLP